MSENIKNIDRLVEIKAGKTGYGLLVESDGYVSMDLSENNKKLVKEALDSRENGEWYVPKPFVLDVILQKFGIENANKRIYPEDVLKREIEKYQKMIADRMALGECYKPDVLVYSEDGLKSMESINVGDSVLSFKLGEDGTISDFVFNPVIVKIEKDFDGDMVTIKSKWIDDVVTPGHKYPLFKLNEGKYIFVDNIDASELKEYADLYIPIMNGIFERVGDMSFGIEKYKGKVMCFEVENHNFCVMCGNKHHFTSNCNHPNQSEIDLGRVSHNIIECHWEDNTLVGKIEFNITEGFRRYGICSSLGDTCANLILNGYKIGVSSRGIGDVVTRLGKLFVNNFELVCFDIVATPSTPGAYIGDYENLQQYVESDDTKVGKSQLSEKIDKIKDILSD